MEKLLKDDKLQYCEELGDLSMPSDSGMVLSVYLRAEYHSKAITCFVQCREYDKMVPHASSVDLKIDYSSIFSQLLFSNPRDTFDLVKGLVNTESGPLIEYKVGKSQLEQKLPVDTIESIINRKDPREYVRVYTDANSAKILNVII